MILEIDLRNPAPRANLVDPANFRAFHAAVATDDSSPAWSELEVALAGFAKVDPSGGRVFIEAGALEQLAGDLSSDSSWRDGFSTMLAYAEEKGWQDDEGRVAAHVEWEFIVPIEPEAFRYVLGHFPTGVAVLTAWESGTPIGMTCNSLTSVSLDPPLIAVCPAKSSQTWPKIRDAGRFILHLMLAGHEEVVQKFAQRDADRFVSVSHHGTVAGPALDDALAWIYCSVVDEHDAGDHTIVVAEVVRLEVGGEGPQPLVFYRGSYGTFTPSTGRPLAG